LRLPFTEPPRSRARSLLLPGLAVVSGLGIAAAVLKLISARRARNATPAAPPTGTAESTPDKPAGTEQHPPNTNPARQGPGTPPVSPKQAFQNNAQAPATGKPAPGASPGQPGVPHPKR